MRACIRLVGGLAAVVLAVLLAVAVTAAVGSRVAVNDGWRAPARGITVWVEDNGVHTSIVMPKRAAGVDWTTVFPAGDLRDPRQGAWAHVAVSWGERGFFVGTPTWHDLRPRVVVRAVVGSDATVLHVEHIAPPVQSTSVRAVVLRAGEYRRLAAYVRASLGTGAVVPGYAGYDAFYPGRGRYDWRMTCNVWTARAFAFAGVRTGWWTPTSGGVMRWF